MAKELRFVRSVEARDAAGQLFTIHVLRYFHFVQTRGGELQAAGQFVLRTSDGTPVNSIAKGEYDILHPMGKFRVVSDDPDAI